MESTRDNLKEMCDIKVCLTHRESSKKGIIDNSNKLSQQDSRCVDDISMSTGKILIIHFFSALNSRTQDYFQEVNGYLTQYFRDEEYNRLLTYITKLLTTEEKDWIARIIKEGK